MNNLVNSLENNPSNKRNVQYSLDKMKDIMIDVNYYVEDIQKVEHKTHKIKEKASEFRNNSKEF